MINLIVRFVLACSCLALLSCTQHFAFVPKNSQLTACMQTCEKRLQDCIELCQNNCAHCSAAAKKSTARHYAHYQQEQCVKGEIVALQLNSFSDPLQCRKTTCNCLSDYRVCLQACSGVIPKRLRDATLCG